MSRDPLEGRNYFACPRRGCYLVVHRLWEVRVVEGLTVHDPEWVCDDCLDQLEGIADLDRLVTVERTERVRG